MKIIKEELIYQYIIEKSKFISLCFNVHDINDVEKILANIKSKYHEARHICFAYIIGENKNIQRFSDDGEPKGTAGFPILNLLLKNEVINTLVIVVRYFGGIKLGTSKLLRSYLLAAENVIKSNLQIYIKKIILEIKFNYSKINKINYYIEKHKINILKKVFSNVVTYKIEIEDNDVMIRDLMQIIDIEK